LRDNDALFENTLERIDRTTLSPSLPRQVLGVRMGMPAAELFALDLQKNARQLVKLARILSFASPALE
jgi:hypothetical protein